jgi:hypothetical protein
MGRNLVGSGPMDSAIPPDTTLDDEHGDVDGNRRARVPMTNTDSTPFIFVPAISLRENERGMHAGAGWNTTWH